MCSFKSTKLSLVCPINSGFYCWPSVERCTHLSAIMAELWLTESHLPTATQDLAIATHTCHQLSSSIHRLPASLYFPSICQINFDLMLLWSENPADHLVMAFTNFHLLVIHHWSVSHLPYCVLDIISPRIQEHRHNHSVAEWHSSNFTGCRCLFWICLVKCEVDGIIPSSPNKGL